jgi:hypothetical protein
MTNDTPQTLSAEEPTNASSRVEEANRRLKRSRSASAKWRRMAVKYYQTYEGDPAPEGVKEQLAEEGRIWSNFNYALSQINAVLGQDIADRKEPRFEGSGYDTVRSFRAEIYTQLTRALYLKCGGHREEAEAFQDQLVTGYGFAESYLDTRSFPIFPRLEAIDCLEMFWDPDAKKHNLRDARYLFRVRSWALEDAIAKWPNKKAELTALSKGKGRGRTAFPERSEASGYSRDTGNAKDSSLRDPEVTIAEYQFKRLEKWIVYQDPRTGKNARVPKKDFGAVSDEILGEIDEATGVPKYEKIHAVELDLEQCFRSFLAGGSNGQELSIELQEPQRLETGMFTIRCATGYRSKNKDGRVTFFGLMSIIYEPQLWIAKAFSAAIEHVARSPKGSAMFFNPEFFEDPADVKANGSKAGYIGLIKTGFDKASHVWERQQAAFPQAYEKIFAIAEDVMPKLTTISDYFKGSATGERSNVLVTNLQGQTIMVLNPLLDPMNQFRIENAKVMAELARLHLAPDDFNALCGEMEAEGITYTVPSDPQTGYPQWDVSKHQPVKQPIMLTDDAGQPIIDEATGQPIPVKPWDVAAETDVFQFDVTVDLGPASSTMKQAIWSNWQQTAFAQKLIEMFPEVGKKIIPWLIKNQPGLSSDEAKRLEGEIRQGIHDQEIKGTMQGVIESLQQLPPDQVQQVFQIVASMLQPQQTAPGAEPAPEQAQ